MQCITHKVAKNFLSPLHYRNTSGGGATVSASVVFSSDEMEEFLIPAVKRKTLDSDPLSTFLASLETDRVKLLLCFFLDKFSKV